LDIRSGKAAGLTVYAVNTGILTKEDLSQADQVFNNMPELLAFLQTR
jgi:phosphoglycolate phosphatase-like HAD superfamily hydrolase